MDEAEGLEIDTFGNPPEHAGPVAVDAVPHHLAHDAADLQETADAIELGHPDRHFVPADFGRQRTALRVDEPRLAGGGPDARIALHPLHQQLEVANRQVQIRIQLAEIVEVPQAYRFQASIESRDHAGPHLSAAAICAPHYAKVW